MVGAESFLIGLDFGTESARGVLLDVADGSQIASHAFPYRHGVMTAALPDGTGLPRGFALQDAADYVEAAEVILAALGSGRRIAGIGLGFTASSPLPARADGTALSALYPSDPHSYVKLWKHAAAQPYAASINRGGGAFLDNFGGKVSGEWLLAKAAQIQAEAPIIWREADRFIEAGDWLVWQLTGVEARSLDFAAYKAQFSAGSGYPSDTVPGLLERLSAPLPVGSSAGRLNAAWQARTGILGEPAVAVAVIDSHVVLPAVGGVSPGTLVGALGTSAAYLLLADTDRPLPFGIEGVAHGAALPDLWCYEAGQAGFGDVLAWFVSAFPRAEERSESFRLYDAAAAMLQPGDSRLLALDWWSGNRVPYADSALSGLIAGFGLHTTSTHIYRALLEALCFGARSIVDHFRAGNLAVDRVVLTSGLTRRNPLLLQIMADVQATEILVPDILNPTAVGAAIHGAVAAGVVADFPEGSARFGARAYDRFEPDARRAAIYEVLYRQYRDLAASRTVRQTLSQLGAGVVEPTTISGTAAAGRAETARTAIGRN
ncbi:carbohydrate kinase [Kaistia algarum]|uniref:FGGY-family carbohydrate kinase n=1 Tax=Kaistia algarum TaxID=2083279 RepID=UPI000CE88901|nr:FGGY-family carbohydrate kinase [Kaistia algarum]MCX5515360.1 FGGY-family carbohydrate kinase [Kaistia algarum]PPE77842.1 carbohydrate kinase [Kaistia algarum]